MKTTTSHLPLHLPEVTERTLTNGLLTLVAERGPIPMVAVRLVIEAGSAQDPAGKEGLADFTGRLLRRGTKTMSANELDDAVEFYGAALGIDAGPDSVSIMISTPSEHLERMLEVLGKLVTEPSFPPEEIEQSKRRVAGAIANMLDEPSAIADRAMYRALFGSHPYGHDTLGHLSTVESFTRDDVVAFHRDRIGPRISLLSIVGKVDKGTLWPALERTVGKWTTGPATLKHREEPSPTAKAGRVVLVDKPDQTQSQIRIARLGPARHHEETYPLRLLESALAGGFTSRLVDEVRVNRGLSYSIGASYDRFRSGGMFSIGTYTQNETTREMIDVVLAEVEQVQKRGLTPKEIQQTKNLLNGLFPMRLEMNESYAAAIADVKLYGFPADYLARYRERLSALTGTQVKQAAQKYLFEEKPVIVIVGNAAEIKSQLEGLGPVERVSLADLQ